MFWKYFKSSEWAASTFICMSDTLVSILAVEEWLQIWIRIRIGNLYLAWYGGYNAPFLSGKQSNWQFISHLTSQKWTSKCEQAAACLTSLHKQLECTGKHWSPGIKDQSPQRVISVCPFYRYDHYEQPIYLFNIVKIRRNWTVITHSLTVSSCSWTMCASCWKIWPSSTIVLSIVSISFCLDCMYVSCRGRSHTMHFSHIQCILVTYGVF